MSRLFKIQKYKLIKILGQEVWGSLLCKYSNIYARFYKVHFRNVCNYVILEYERRVLFDFRHRYKNSFISKTAVSFKEKKRFFEFQKQRGIHFFKLNKTLQYFVRSDIDYWLKRNNKSQYPAPFFPLFSYGFLGYGALLFALIRFWVNKRKKFSKRPSFSRFKNKARFTNRRKFPAAQTSRRRLFKPHSASTSQQRHFSYTVRNKPNAKLPYRYKRPFKSKSKWTKSIMKFKPTKDRSIKFIFYKKRNRIFVSRKTTNFIPQRFRRKYFYIHRPYGLPSKIAFLVWAKRFLSKTKELYNLSNKGLLKKHYSPFFVRYLTYCWKVNAPFSNKLFKRFSKQIHARPAKIRLDIDQKKIGLLITNINQLKRITKSFIPSPLILLTTIPPIYYDGTYCQSRTPWYLFKFQNPILFEEVRLSLQPPELIHKSFGLYNSMLSTSKILTTLGDIKRKLQDRKEIIFVLNYSTKKLKLGDYEDGFRIPRPLRGSSKRRNKKQFRLLNLYRYRTFYGIFDVKNFQTTYVKLSKHKGSVFLNFFQFLECRIVFILHLSGLFPSVYFINYFIKHKNLTIGHETVLNPNRLLHVNENLFIPTSYYWTAVNTLIFKLTHTRLLLNTPRFMELNRVILAIRLITYPKNNERTLPFSGVHSLFDPYSLLRSEI